MAFRPEEAHWFDLYVPREQTVYAVEALASTNLVQLEVDPTRHSSLDLKKLKDTTAQYKKLMPQYSAYLPAPGQFSTTFESTPDEDAENNLEIFIRVTKDIDSLLDNLDTLTHKQANLRLLEEYLESLGSNKESLASIARHTEFLFKVIYACPRHCGLEVDQKLKLPVCKNSHGKDHDFFLLADKPQNQNNIGEFFKNTGCEVIHIPEWLEDDELTQEKQLRKEIESVQVDISRVDEQLKGYQKSKRAGQAVSSLEILSWYTRHAGETSFEKKHCYITGWATTDNLSALQNVLDRSNIHSIIRFCKPPAGTDAPVTSRLSWWSAPFQIFTTMMGTPGREEVDPSIVLPFIVPLLFGYMFPDMGHGLILMAAGLLLFKRWPAGRFLVPCGLAASLFGYMFGEVFGIEGVLPATWIHPLDDPIAIMLVPLFFGIFLMLLGLVFNGIEAWWRNEIGLWLLSGAAVLTLYASALLAFIHFDALWITLLSLVWYTTGSLIRLRLYHFPDFIPAMGNLLQSIFELFLNTISFLRVGAFALAHAALTSGAMQLVYSTENTAAQAIIFVILQIFIIVLEGFIVFVQTTRLILFEFFLRFLRVDGRIFKPLRNR
jgi:V/A-type H+-transporting ATPase subunit I